METKTINLRGMPEDLVRRAKVYAAWRGLTLKDFIMQAIEASLAASGANIPELASAFVLGAERKRTSSRPSKRKPRQQR